MTPLLRLPRLVDLHVHLRDPGETHKENFLTGTQAAVSGGFSLICDMPNNAELIDTREALLQKIAVAQETIVCDVGFYFGSIGDNLHEFERIRNHVLGLKLYLSETTGGYVLPISKIRDVYCAWKSEKPILLHAEGDVLDAVLPVVRETKQKTHLCHVSGSHDLGFVIGAKRDGLPITCGVTPHHLFLSQTTCAKLGPFGLVHPAVGTDADRSFLWNHLPLIDVFESDHAPHTSQEKTSPHPPWGMPGLETMLPLFLHAVSQRRLTIADVILRLHTNPLKILGIASDPGSFVAIDTKTSYTVTGKNLHTRCAWTPFEGWSMNGAVRQVVLRGHTVFSDGTIPAGKRWGQIVPHLSP